MAEIGGVGARPLPPGGAEQKANVPGAKSAANGTDALPANLLPTPLAPPNQPASAPQPGTNVAGKVIVPDVVTGRDPSQQVAGERLRTSGAPGSATEKLLGLDWRPTVVGGFPPPPGNAEALRHLSPAMRRAVFRSLLDKQREQLTKLNRLAGRRDGQREGGDEEHRDGQQDKREENLASADESQLEKIDSRQLARAGHEIKQVFRMLETVERMLAMQDYTLSQMGTFSKG